MATTYQVSIGERTLKVTLRREGDTLYARIGRGAEMPVRLEAAEGTLTTLVAGDRRVELLVQRTADATLIALNGVQFQADVVDEARARLANVAGAAHGGAKLQLKAPMPGLVVKVLCQPGDTVTKGQPLVVLQAMKMENELSLPGDGTITSVHVQAGQTVEQNAVLVTVE